MLTNVPRIGGKLKLLVEMEDDSEDSLLVLLPFFLTTMARPFSILLPDESIEMSLCLKRNTKQAQYKHSGTSSCSSHMLPGVIHLKAVQNCCKHLI